jgi:amino acid adenylation domain-containing protein
MSTDLYQQLAALSPEQRALFEQRLQQRGIALPQPLTIPRQTDKLASERSPIPLSFAQQRLWFIQQLDPTSTIYNVPCALRLRGSLHIPALEQSLNAIMQRHESLRTTFCLDEATQPQQVIALPQFQSLPIVEIQTDIDSTDNIDRTLEQAIRTIVDRPFDLAQPLLRSSLLRLSAMDSILVLATHHIVSDRWSIGVFLRELSLFYRAFSLSQPVPFNDLPIQYGDWAIWQREQLQGETLATQQAYWQQQLSGELPILQLPSDRPRPAIPSYQGSHYSVALSPALSAQLKTLAAESGITLFMLLLASFQILLYRYTQQTDLLIGSDIANRDRRETEGLIGLLVNTLVLRTSLAGNPTVREVLDRVREVTLGAYAHQQLPFEQVVELINPDRVLSQMMPLFQVKFDLQLAEVQSLELDQLKTERLPIEDLTVKYELRLNLQDTLNRIQGQFEFSRDLFDTATIAQMNHHWQILLAAIVHHLDQPISELSILPQAEQQQLQQWNQTQRPYPTDRCIHQLVETQVDRTPDAIALIAGTQTLTYQELNQRANQLAHFLQSLGVKPNTTVGVCLDRTPILVIALLAILKSGAAYVPLDPTYPPTRLNWILSDANVPILLTHTAFQPTFTQSSEPKFELKSEPKIVDLDDWTAIAAFPTSNPTSAVTPDSLAYLIYTSGSTGTPKGVMIAHQSTVCLLYWAQEVFSPTAIAGVLAATSVCFDLSVFELFVPLSWGGQVILAENALALPQLPAANQVTLINTVPSAIAHLLQTNGIPASVNTINLAGEPLSDRLVRQLHQLPQQPAVFNLYGPSEATTYATVAPLKPDDPNFPSIGRAIANTQVYVLDDQHQPVPIGVPGELYLGGAGLALGYWQRPDLTAERFVPHPQSLAPVKGTSEHPSPDRGGVGGEVLYKTGDRVRWRQDGNLEFLGRRDHQIKLRGYRIELGEIESVLSQYAGIDQAIVAVQAILNQPQLIAYLTPSTINLDDIQQWVSDRLPGYMIPAQWIMLDAMPLTTNGKIDRRALPIPNQVLNQPFIAPETVTEQALVRIWQQALAQAMISTHANFFELGGHSLLGMTIMARISAELGIEIPLRYLFQYPTIAQLAAAIDRLDPSAMVTVSLPQIQSNLDDRHQPFPLTDIQQAYLVGRSAAFELGNIATHGYREIETTGLTVKQVEWAFQQLIDRHDMLRVVMQPDGQQRVLAQVPPYRIPVLDLRGQAPSAVEAQLASIRDRLSHQLLPTDRYPLFEIQAVQLESDRIRFCVSFDVLIGDAWSFQLLGRELASLLQQSKPDLPAIALTFRDYVLAEQTLHHSPLYQRSLTYWQNRLDSLPAAPDLPLTQPLSAITAPQFARRSDRLEPATWQALKQQASQVGITPSALVLTVFAAVLSRWSRHAHFTLTLTLFNRLPLHPEVDRLVGDFTASSLLEIDQRPTRPLIDHAHHLQAQLWQDLDHRFVSGVEVLRQLAQRQQRVTDAIMPVVFTSTLTQPIPDNSTDRPWQTEVVYSLSQTSQVYFDHQVSEVGGALVFNWDTIDALFPAGMLDAMFSSYSQVLAQLAANSDLWQTEHLPLLPADQVAILSQLNHTTHVWQSPSTDDLLQQLFFRQVVLQPDAIAVITPERQLTYQQLSDRVCSLAQQLRALGAEPNQLIAIVMERGWEQVVAVLAILTAGAAYVPLDPTLPGERMQLLLRSTDAAIILTQSWIDNSFSQDRVTIAVDQWQVPDHLPAANPAAIQQPDDLAYVIYTSGSTGQPKGVMMHHQAVVNTLLEVNHQFGINQCDRVFALSALSFDLSVYDIFGTLAAGGAIVIPDQSHLLNPEHWQDLILQHQVTVWNSVPALFQLLIDHLSLKEPFSCQLRVALLSGDWIPLTLPEQATQSFPSLQLISLGGATEAAIWSIAYPITTVAPTWKSIPYGRPLANQQLSVLNAALQPCPIGVTGELYIGGMGVTSGYWRDPEKTAAALVPKPSSLCKGGLTETELFSNHTSGVLYKTGDLGRHGADGTIEFLGRADFQVKLNGYRVELGEIEAALQHHPGIQQAIVTVNGTGHAQQLVAYVVPHPEVLAQTQAQPGLPPLAQLDFKQQQRNLRIAKPEQPRIPLPSPTPATPNWQRQSYRQFLPAAIALEAFSAWLSHLQAYQDESPLPKYRYASAGSLYPVQTYLFIQPGRITGLDAGVYYYHPQHHELIHLSSSMVDGSHFGINQSLVEQSAFTVFLVGQLDAIAPIYGERSRDFCLLEAGYISQLLMETAPQFELGLCPIGDLDFAALRSAFDLDANHLWLHSLAGGAIDLAWTKQRQPLVAQPPPSPQTLMRQKLNDFLAQTLPTYLIPQVYIPLAALPLTANGKVDRRALPAPLEQLVTTPFVAPQTDLERAIADIWQRTLGIERVGIHDHFFDLGGNSLTALQIIGQLRQQLQVELSIQDFFTQATIAEQAQILTPQISQDSQPDKIQPVERLSTERSQQLLENLDHLSEAEVETLLAALEEESR